ncbi:MAG: Lipoprotein signal peptidase, partial [uncultured Rubellimicrobium sp.]
ATLAPAPAHAAHVLVGLLGLPPRPGHEMAGRPLDGPADADGDRPPAAAAEPAHGLEPGGELRALCRDRHALGAGGAGHRHIGLRDCLGLARGGRAAGPHLGGASGRGRAGERGGPHPLWGGGRLPEHELLRDRESLCVQRGRHRRLRGGAGARALCGAWERARCAREAREACKDGV